MTLIIQCSDQKQRVRMEAQRLYCSQLFTKARNYAIWTGHPWLIFSALHGLTKPNEIVDPYDVSMSSPQRITIEKLRGQKPPGRIVSLCSKAYNKILLEAGYEFEDPMKALFCGQRKMWFLKRIVL